MNRILSNRYLAGPITREEQSDGTVAYKDMALIDHGVWTDAGSGEPTEYDPAELEVVDDNVLNIAHDADNEVSAVGHIEADSYYAEDGTGYANIVLDMDSPASEYADENLQAALESNGQVGFGGPSIEIPAGAYDLEEGEEGYPKLVNGEIHGAGLVMDPASKSTSFARQTAERGVALSTGEGSNSVWLKDDAMSDKTLQDVEEIMGVLGGHFSEMHGEIVDAMNATEDEGEEAFANAVSGILDEHTEEIRDELGGEGGEEQEDVEAEEEGYDEEEESEMSLAELEAKVNELEEREDRLEEEMEALKAEYEDKDKDMSEEVEALRDELAEAETVQELEEAKEDLDKRLSKLEDEPKPPKSMSDDSSDDMSWLEGEVRTSRSERTGL